METQQFKALMGVLGEILSQMPVREIPPVVEPVPAPSEVLANHRRNLQDLRNATKVGTPDRARAAEVAANKRQALAIVRAVLDDWIKGAKENHEASGHRHENTGEECWRTFHAQDIRNMINDAARELGVEQFPRPEVAEEDKKR